MGDMPDKIWIENPPSGDVPVHVSVMSRAWNGLDGPFEEYTRTALVDELEAEKKSLEEDFTNHCIQIELIEGRLTREQVKSHDKAALVDELINAWNGWNGVTDHKYNDFCNAMDDAIAKLKGNK